MTLSQPRYYDTVPHNCLVWMGSIIISFDDWYFKQCSFILWWSWLVSINHHWYILPKSWIHFVSCIIGWILSPSEFVSSAIVFNVFFWNTLLHIPWYFISSLVWKWQFKNLNYKYDNCPTFSSDGEFVGRGTSQAVKHMLSSVQSGSWIFLECLKDQ